MSRLDKPEAMVLMWSRHISTADTTSTSSSATQHMGIGTSGTTATCGCPLLTYVVPLCISTKTTPICTTDFCTWEPPLPAHTTHGNAQQHLSDLPMVPIENAACSTRLEPAAVSCNGHQLQFHVHGQRCITSPSSASSHLQQSTWTRCAALTKIRCYSAALPSSKPQHRPRLAMHAALLPSPNHPGHRCAASSATMRHGGVELAYILQRSVSWHTTIQHPITAGACACVKVCLCHSLAA